MWELLVTIVNFLLIWRNRTIPYPPSFYWMPWPMQVIFVVPFITQLKKFHQFINERLHTLRRRKLCLKGGGGSRCMGNDMLVGRCVLYKMNYSEMFLSLVLSAGYLMFWCRQGTFIHQHRTICPTFCSSAYLTPPQWSLIELVANGPTYIHGIFSLNPLPNCHQVN